MNAEKRCAFHTLGCKVNQYDTQAMREAFERAGYRVVPFSEDADVYLINTCTVTGTGDDKSMKLIRRTARNHPGAEIIVAGCLAQRDAGRVKLPGVRLILGVRHRARVVELYERALSDGICISAIDEEDGWTFEHLTVTRHEGKTRAVMKIQEGCDRYCTYCIIPYVRGPVRSLPVEEVAREAERLAAAGYREIVLTGIHLASYGRGIDATLLDAVRAVHRVDGVARIRLGSLEPLAATEEFVRALQALPKVCHQFHLSMQSGSDGVLRRMRRRYTPQEFLQAARRLQSAFDDCALTTDVLTGFPGETDEEARETLEFVKTVGFARIHVFPYSRREGTAADKMPNQVGEEIKKHRVAQLLELGNRLEIEFVKKTTGSVQTVLFEEQLEGGMSEGYTGGYVRVRAAASAGALLRVYIKSTEGTLAYGVPV